MIEEAEFQRTLAAVNDTPCPFEKAVLNAGFGCACSLRMWLADRESASCTCPTAQPGCVQTLQALRLEAAGVLEVNETVQHLPHNQELRVQRGSLLGVQRALTPVDEASQVLDILALLRQAQRQWGPLAQWPYPEILAVVAQQPSRPRRPPR